MSYSVRPHRWQPTRLPHPWGSPGKNSGVGCHFLFQCMKVKSQSVKLLSRVQLLATPGTAAFQAPPSMGFSRQDYWSGVPSSSPMKYYSAIKENEVLPLVTTWMDLEGIMLSEMSDKERQIPYDITYVESKKQTSEYNKKETDSEIEKTSWWLLWGEGKEQDRVGPSTMYKISSTDMLRNTGNRARIL